MILDQSIKVEPRQRWMWWHWQNLNDRRDGTHGSGLREGRCWWHFRSKNNRPGPVITFEWNLWRLACGIGIDIDDEDVTLGVAFPPVSFYLSFSTEFWLISRLAPRKALSPQYPDTIVIDQRECSFRVHNGTVWLKFWGPRDEWHRDDPWWKRGINFSINPFEWKHISHLVRRADGSWVPFVGSWEPEKIPDEREQFSFPYRYLLKNGTVQERVATVHVERWEWRPRCLQWTKLFAKVRKSIDVLFSDEVGERSGSWKGGCTGCGYDLLLGETPEQCLRRMERNRKF